MVGWWPSRAVTFASNHDVELHWPVHDRRHLAQMYAYILTFLGTPCVFIKDATDPVLADSIAKLMQLRRAQGLHASSPVDIWCAQQGVYAACIGDCIVVKIGEGAWSPKCGSLLLDGPGYAVWSSSGAS